MTQTSAIGNVLDRETYKSLGLKFGIGTTTARDAIKNYTWSNE